MNIVDRLKLWARLTPPAEGPVTDDVQFVVFAIDQHGRVYRITDATISNGTFNVITKGRTAIMNMMDQLDVQDLPDMEGL